MASILVVGQDQRSLERFHRVLSAEGWRVRTAPGRAQALQAAAVEPPDLVVAGSEVAGADELAGVFRRSAGGPGIVVVLAEGGSPAGVAVLGDDRLRLPFADQDLVGAVRRLLATSRDSSGAPAPPLRLTSQDIFGDVLAEVEGQLPGRGAPPPPSPPAAAPPPANPPPPAGRGLGLSRDHDDVQRKLEQTLSGMLGSEPRRTGAAAGAAPQTSASSAAVRRQLEEASSAADIDAMLSKTLSDLGARPARRATLSGVPPARPAAAPVGPAPAAASQVTPAAAAPQVTGPTAASLAPPRAAAPATAAKSTPPTPPPPVSAVAGTRTGSRPGTAAGGAAPLGTPPAGVASAAAPAAPATPATPATPAINSVAANPARRRFTGELDLSELDELARTRRKVEPSSRPGVPVAAPPAATAPAGGDLGESPAATQRIQMVPREPAEAAGVQFGQYTLLERIAAGGMAEVWKARMRGVEGFQKTVAIKKILPYMTDSADFVGMFIDEAKLAAQLSHPNIVHIYDLGKIGADFYIAMEYVEGKDLRSLLNAGRQHGMPLPLGLALLIGLRLASALDYAHRKLDFEGREIGLVHRDVSPQNVLISLDGDVKLCDFGIAKAVSKAGQTHTGALKGKLQYMSPEQAKGEPVDARSDIFSLGTVLFEMLTGERLFEGDSEMSVLEAVQQVKVRPPRQVDPTIPREVDEIVTRALAGRAEDRLQSAGEVAQRLEALLYALKPSPSHADLAAYLKRALEKPAPGVRPDRVQPGRPSQPAVAAGQGRPSSQPAPALPVPPAPPTSPSGVPYAPILPPATGAAPLHAAPPAEASPARELAPPAPLAPIPDVPLEEGEGSRRNRLLLVAAIAALLVIALLTYFLRARRAPAVPSGVPPAAATHAAAVPAPGLPGAAATPSGAATPSRAGTAAGSAVKPSPGAPGAGKAVPAGSGKVDVEGLVGQELARREQALKKKLEDQQKQLQTELDKTKGAKPPVQATAAPTASPTPSTPATPAAAPAGAAAPPAASNSPAAAASGGESSRGGSRSSAAPPAETRQSAEAAATSTPPAAPSSGGAPGTAGGAGASVPPKLVSSPKPEYPPLARKLRVEGVVVISALVGEDGQVEDVRLLEPSEGVGFNEAAMQAARGAHFRPGTRDGVPIKMWARLRIPFKLN